MAGDTFGRLLFGLLAFTGDDTLIDIECSFVDRYGCLPDVVRAARPILDRIAVGASLRLSGKECSGDVRREVAACWLPNRLSFWGFPPLLSIGCVSAKFSFGVVLLVGCSNPWAGSTPLAAEKVDVVATGPAGPPTHRT